MKIATINRLNDPISLKIYYQNLKSQLCNLGIEIIDIDESDQNLMEFDLVWDPGMCMRPLPNTLFSSRIPIIGSMHGVKAYSLPLDDLIVTKDEEMELVACKNTLDKQWEELKYKIAALVTVSDYAKEEIVNAVNIDPKKVFTIYNGVDTGIFKKEGRSKNIGKPYFFHVSTLNPIKNFNRLLDAYTLLPEDTRPDLVAVIPEYPIKANINGVHIISKLLPQQEIAEWYRGAVALIFPSLRETFGMPIIEAMSCGIPVITSNNTACAEISGNAAVLINPRSIEDLRNSMLRICTDDHLSNELIQKGIIHVRKFSWQKSAIQFRQLFNQVLKQTSDGKPKMRKLEVTTVTGCHFNCTFCPQLAFTKNYKEKISDNTYMSFQLFKTCIDKIPVEIGINFGGMSEPFQNKECTKMVIYAKERGHTIEIFTTMSGLDFDNLNKILNYLTLANNGGDDKFYVHLPSDNRWEHITVSQDLIDNIKFIINNDYDVKFHYHGYNIHKRLRNIAFNHRLNHWPLHNRSVNETSMIKKSDTKKGRISCVMNMEVNSLIPNGDVLLCCQDFGIDYILGNLLKDDLDCLYKSKTFQNVLISLQDDSIDSICRHCHFAIEEDKDWG